MSVPSLWRWSCSVGKGLSSVIGSDLIHTCEIGKEKFRDDWRTFGTAEAQGLDLPVWTQSFRRYWPYRRACPAGLNPFSSLFVLKVQNLLHMAPYFIIDEWKEQERRWPAQGRNALSFATFKVLDEKSWRDTKVFNSTGLDSKWTMILKWYSIYIMTPWRVDEPKSINSALYIDT